MLSNIGDVLAAPRQTWKPEPIELLEDIPQAVVEIHATAIATCALQSEVERFCPACRVRHWHGPARASLRPFAGIGSSISFCPSIFLRRLLATARGRRADGYQRAKALPSAQPSIAQLSERA
jgi:hypothetical protein